jgi:integrase/recombinase XerC
MLTGAGPKVVDHPHIKHECDTSTAIYTHVSDDYMNRALRKALSPALDKDREDD